MTFLIKPAFLALRYMTIIKIIAGREMPQKMMIKAPYPQRQLGLSQKFWAILGPANVAAMRGVPLIVKMIIRFFSVVISAAMMSQTNRTPM